MGYPALGAGGSTRAHQIGEAGRGGWAVMLTGALGLREGEESVHVASKCGREHTCLGCVADAARPTLCLLRPPNKDSFQPPLLCPEVSERNHKVNTEGPRTPCSRDPRYRKGKHPLAYCCRSLATDRREGGTNGVKQ